MTYLGMQVLIEGLALAAFQSIRDKATNPLAGAVNAYVMQDEARHVVVRPPRAARLLSAAHRRRARRARGVRGRGALPHARPLQPAEVWERLGLPVEDAGRDPLQFQADESFRGRLFTRIVPTVKDIGLWGPRVQKAFADMGVMEFAKIDVAEQLANDGQVAEEFDRKMFVEKAIAAE